MRYFDKNAVAAALDPRALMRALREAFSRGAHAPPREHHALNASNSRALLLMPAWDDASALGVKLVTVFTDNAARGLPAVNACYVLFDGEKGSVRAVLEGNELTLRRTGAASALASEYLSRPDSTKLLMVGTGALAPHMIRSHCSVRPIDAVRIWGRSAERARGLASTLGNLGIDVQVADDLSSAVRWADIISCATLATEPVILGAWLMPGQHLDLVGSFKATMREADALAIQRSKIFVDTRAGAMADAGEIIHALQSGALQATDIQADLHDLAQGRHAGRGSAGEITLFKSVGHALEDLAAARLVLAHHMESDRQEHGIIDA